jgi:HrpA-like RNA helicase
MSILPAERHGNDIIAAVEQNETVIICGQTGCGKSTVIPRVSITIDFYE